MGGVCWRQWEFERGWTSPTTHPISNTKREQDVRGMSGSASLSGSAPEGADEEDGTTRKFEAWVKEIELGVVNEPSFGGNDSE